MCLYNAGFTVSHVKKESKYCLFNIMYYITIISFKNNIPTFNSLTMIKTTGASWDKGDVGLEKL